MSSIQPDSPGKRFEAFKLSHRYADTDQDVLAIHHTIGDGPFQAASGRDLKLLEQLFFDAKFTTGDVKMSLKPTVDAGWLELNGQEVSREDYANLFIIFGTTYGAGDGSTTFELPDLSDRFPMGQGGGVLGALGGSATDLITTSVESAIITNYTGGGAGTAADNNHTHTATVDTVPPYMRIKFLVKV